MCFSGERAAVPEPFSVVFPLGPHHFTSYGGGSHHMTPIGVLQNALEDDGHRFLKTGATCLEEPGTKNICCFFLNVFHQYIHNNSCRLILSKKRGIPTRVFITLVCFRDR